MHELQAVSSSHLLQLLASLSFFQEVPERERKELLNFLGQGVRLLSYRMGEFLIRQQDAKEKSFFILLSGQASVVKSGSSMPLAQLQTGECFGEVSFLTDRPRISNVIVHAPELPRDTALRTLLEEILGMPLVERAQDNPALVMCLDREVLPKLSVSLRNQLKSRIIAQMAGRLNDMNERITHVTGQTPLLSEEGDFDDLVNKAAGQESLSLSPEEQEFFKDQLIGRLIQVMDEMNVQLTHMGSE
ncbi:MAG: cyclic nucleotide-binding domain-containing protein [Magnetococcales bacterium]|nr:cyclic nucleotide-binding domain-containing protein [Magnetococcales bacterium]MBF0310716.1 cyclic nucleotide-binding domain-containing protein [Magnetococcales bacterium]